MASADAPLRLDKPDRIRFAHSPLSALMFTVISLAFAWLCWNYIQDSQAIRIGFTAFALLFVAVGLLGIFWRLEIDIDLRRRRATIRRGFWPNPKERNRTLDELEGIGLSLKYRSSGTKNSKRKAPWWYITLKFSGDQKGTDVFVSANERAAYERWEYIAKRLQVDAIDNTSESPQRRDWQHLDTSLQSKVQQEVDSRTRPPEQPADSKVTILEQGSQKELLLPRLGFNGGLVFVLLFGSAFAALGAGALLANFGVLDMDVEGGTLAMTIIPPVFILVGLGTMWLGISGSFSSLVVGIENGLLYTEYLGFRMRSGRKSVALAEIESLDIGGDVRSRQRSGRRMTIGGLTLGSNRYRDRENEVVVRSDKQILRFGSSLGEADRAWVADVCRYATARGKFP